MDTTLEMQIKTTGQETLKVLKDLNTSITGLVTTLNKVQGSTSSIENLGKASEKTLGKVDKLSTSFNKLFSAMAVKKIGVKAFEFLTQASDRAEELNLFNVIFKNIKKNGEDAFSDLGLAATRFQNKLNEAFGTNMTETLRYQGLFQAMATNQGIGEKYASVMSENMVKLTYDLASLYNKSEKTVAEALRGGVYAGQTKPLRGFGIDVTQTSMKPVLESLGITDRSINEMSQAEKQILRYIATLNQAKAAMGDFAETIESPANQLKILKQQIVETKVAIGNLFMGMFSEILPYANAFLMVIKEIAKAIADLFGIRAGDYNSGLASTEEIYDGIATGAGNAAKATKELKRQLLKFDEVNNITTPKSSGSGSGSGLGAGGIDKRLLEAISGYDNLMDKVKMKATEIRDRIMEWLGFTKHIDEETGKVYFKLKDGLTNIKLIGTVLGVITSTKIIKGIGNLVTGTGKLAKFFGTDKIIKNLKSLAGYITDFTKSSGSYVKGITSGTSAWLLHFSAISKISVGLPVLVGSLYLASESAKGLASGTSSLVGAIAGFTGTLAGAAAGGAILGSVFGPAGIAVGATAGAMLDLVTYITSYNQKVLDIEAHERVFDGLGTRITDLSSYYDGLFNNATKYSGTLEDLRTKYEQSETNIKNAEYEVEKFKAALDLQDETISKSQLKELQDKYDNLKNAIKESYGANIAYATGMIKAYQDTSKESTESVAIQIANTKKLMLAEQGYEIEFQDRMSKLAYQYYSGKIGLDEYNAEVFKLQEEFGKIPSAGVNAESAIANFNKQLVDIDYESPEKTADAIENISKKFDSTITTLNNEKDNVNKYWDKYIENAQNAVKELELLEEKGTISEKQKEMLNTYKEEISQYTQNKETAMQTIETTITEIQGSYKGYLATILTDLTSNGADLSSEFSGTMDTIQDDLTKLQDVDMSGFGKTMFDGMIKSIVDNESPYLINIGNKFNKYGINAGDEFGAALSKRLDDTELKSAVYDSSFKTGQEAPKGFKQGSYDYIQKYGAGGEDLVKGFVGPVRDGLKIKSPSKVMEELGSYAVQGFIVGIEDESDSLKKAIQKMLSEIKKQFNENIFTLNIDTNIEKSFNSILTKLQTFTSKFRTGINNMLKGMSTAMNNIRVGSDNKIVYTSMPSITVPKFANGGFPEDGFFYANHNELVGKFNNGKNAVANNEQIIEGIQSGVYNAVLSAMSQYGGGTSQIDVHVHTDEGTVVDRINQKTKQTGRCPINIPSY